MSFAIWRKCDFQIHSPRDPNWIGSRLIGRGQVLEGKSSSVTDDEIHEARARWAKTFVDKCLEKGLQAIALTDHHEMVMVPYVKAEIERREKTDPTFDLWLFPGMELTALGGKQCLILFDADLSEEWWRQAQGALGIEYANVDENAATAPPRVTHLTCHYPDIAERLDQFEGLKGRYIILPNVSQGNAHTVLVKGGHGEFSRMKYVGGYLDNCQTINNLTSKNLRRLSGTHKKWSSRHIYPLPTSDSRSADYRQLGENDTWIKLAQPTAEAIRQAFLGHKSRIRIETPIIPSQFIKDITIQRSTILAPNSMPLSPEFNAMIGGRGSGKSSFLEYLAFGLGRSCYDAPRERYSGSGRMKGLIEDTLLENTGSVSLTIIQDGAEFKIERSKANNHQPKITYPNGDTQSVSPKELRDLFPAVVYSQGELSEVGKHTGEGAPLSELLQFVNPKYKEEDDRLATDVESAKSTVRSAIQAVEDYWRLQATLRRLTTNRDSLRQRIEALEKTLPTLSDEDQAAVQFYDQATEFETKRVQASKHADRVMQELQAAAAEFLNERDLSSELTGDVVAIQRGYKEFYDTLSAGLTELCKSLKEKREALARSEAEWAEKYKQARKKRDGALEKLGNHKAVTQQIIKLREEATQLTNKIGDVETKLRVQEEPSVVLKEALAKLRQANRNRDTRTQEWAREIQKLSNEKIKATVIEDGDASEIREAVDILAARTGSQEAARASRLEEALNSNTAVEVVDQLLEDCLHLLHWRLLGEAAGDERPSCEFLMKILGNTEKIRAAVTERLDTTRVEALATAVSRPKIALSYCDGSREISFEKASDGQRAAALLFMLLEQPGGPLIIDQPEGDLDNKIIAELTEKLHDAKQRRQLIFASHNSNIVVNGSAELVGYLEVDVTGTRQFECAGAIDVPRIREVITETMEGGEKAFKDRYDKYGY